MDEIRMTQRMKGPPIYIVSGGTGASAELLVRTVLAQFHDVDVPLIIKNHVHALEQVEDVVDEIANSNGIIVHTMVNDACRRRLIDIARDQSIFSVDLVIDLQEHLKSELGQAPLGQPGLYRRLHQSYFDRVEAIEYAVAHDDARRPEDLPDADIVLIGVSRVGKTPLSMYLSILGWKTANIPFIMGIPLPKELDDVEPNRIVALVIEPAQLMTHRRWRKLRTGIPEGSYVARDPVVEELRAAKHYFYKTGIPVVDITQKPIETAADEVVAHVSQRR